MLTSEMPCPSVDELIIMFDNKFFDNGNILRTNFLIHRQFDSRFEPKLCFSLRRFDVNVLPLFFP